jgi:hypothetical protein
MKYLLYLTITFLLFESCSTNNSAKIKKESSRNIVDTLIEKSKHLKVKNGEENSYLNVNNPEPCNLDRKKILNIEYIKSKMLLFNNDLSNCLEEYIKEFEVQFDEENNFKVQKEFFNTLEYIYKNSNGYSSELIEGIIVDDFLFHRYNSLSLFLSSDKSNKLNEALSLGISAKFSVFNGRDRDSIYSDLLMTLKSKPQSDENNYMIKLVENIDRNFYD